MIGQRLSDDIEIRGLLRTTLFGGVYLARQISLQRDVAVRVIDPARASPDALARFAEETRRLARLSHPNIAQIHLQGQFQGQYFVVFELVSGDPLADRIHDPSLDLRERLRIMTRVARGLQALHGLGIVHRGMTPQTIVVNGSVAKIVTLELAADLASITVESEAAPSSNAAEYLAPEQIDGREVGNAADMFAFGVILYELVKGRHPFAASHPMGVLHRILHAEPHPIEDTPGTVAPPLAALVRRCLDKDPARRPFDMLEIERAMTEIVDGSPAAAWNQDGQIRTRNNPYGRRAMIRHQSEFVGRLREVRRVFASLDASPPGSIAIVGEHKVGKSSFLAYIHMRANRERFLESHSQVVMVFLDLSQWDHLTVTTLCQAILEMAALELTARMRVDDCPHSLDGLRLLAKRLHTQGYKLVLLFDEFERVTNNPEFPLEFFASMRSMVNHYDVAYVTSSERDLQSLCHSRLISDSPFFNIFSALTLGPFSEQEARELIREPSAAAGHPLEPVTDIILDVAGRLPLFVQIACWHAVELGLESVRDNPDEFTRAVELDARPHFEASWSRLKRNEQDVLQRVSSARKIPDALNHVAASLAQSGFLSGAKPERIASKAFQVFVHRVATRARGRDRRRRALTATAGAVGIAAAGLALQGWTDRVPDSGFFTVNKSLVIAASDYEQGWDTLAGARDDARLVAGLLAVSSQVDTLINPTSSQLRESFRQWVAYSEKNRDSRLLVYFAGHGYVDQAGSGYIVPVDCPPPQADSTAFASKAISMAEIVAVAEELRARHVLFVIDACFGGSVFNAASTLDVAPATARKQRVRQFLTSGTATERVPDRSVFAQAFASGLGGAANGNGDDWITGRELWRFIRDQVSQASGNTQAPRMGMLPGFDHGDFLFPMPKPDP